MLFLRHEVVSTEEVEEDHLEEMVQVEEEGEHFVADGVEVEEGVELQPCTAMKMCQPRMGTFFIQLVAAVETI